MSLSLYIHIYIYIYTCLSPSLSIYIYIHRDREKKRYTHFPWSLRRASNLSERTPQNAARIGTLGVSAVYTYI